MCFKNIVGKIINNFHFLIFFDNEKTFKINLANNFDSILEKFINIFPKFKIDINFYFFIT